MMLAQNVTDVRQKKLKKIRCLPDGATPELSPARQVIQQIKKLFRGQTRIIRKITYQLKQSVRRQRLIIRPLAPDYYALLLRGYFPSNCQAIRVPLLAVSSLYRLMAAMRVKASNSKAKPAPAVETSDSINAQIAAFLKSGGEIQQIAKGVSGQTFGPSKQITLGKK
jgi:hypothetical protein